MIKEIKHSKLFSDIEESWKRGELEGISRHALPFLVAHLNEIQNFIDELNRFQVDLDLDLLIKLFIFRRNMPFNMGDYMMRQCSFVKKQLESCCAPSQSGDQDRQSMASQWIKQFAEEHRRQEIFRQIFLIEKMKDEILPVLADKLH